MHNEWPQIQWVLTKMQINDCALSLRLHPTQHSFSCALPQLIAQLAASARERVLSVLMAVVRKDDCSCARISALDAALGRCRSTLRNGCGLRLLTALPPPPDGTGEELALSGADVALDARRAAAASAGRRGEAAGDGVVRTAVPVSGDT